MIGVGGIEWNFGARYLAGPAIQKAKNDLIVYRGIAVSAEESQRKLEEAVTSAGRAAQNQVKAYTQLAAAQKQLDVALGPRGLIGAGQSGGMQKVNDFIDVEWYKSYKDAADGTREFNHEMLRLTGTIQEDIKKQREKKQVNEDLAESFRAAAQVVVAFFAAFASDEIKDFIQESTLLAARVENLGTVMENVGSLAGYTRGGLKNLEDQAERLGVTTAAARKGLAQLAQAEIDLAQNAKLVRIAQDAAVIAGINSSEAYERIVIAIQRTNTWMLRNLGIMVNLNNLYREHAITTGRVSTTLSTLEKQQLVLNEVVRKGTFIQGTYESALQDAYKQYTSLDRIIEQAKVQFGEQFLPIFREGVALVSSLIQSFTDASDSTQVWMASLAAFAVAASTTAASLAALAGSITLVRIAAGDWVGLLATAAVAVGVLGAASVGLIASSEAEARAMKEATEAAEANENSVQRLIVVYERLNELGDSGENGIVTNEASLREINTLVAEAVTFLPEFANKLKQLDQSRPKELAKALAEINAEIAIGASQRTEKLSQEVKNLQAELEKAEEAFDSLAQDVNATEFGGTGLLSDTAEAAQELQVRLAAAQGALIAAQQFENEVVSRLFQKQSERQETAYNQALRVLNQYNTDRINSWEDANLEIALDFEKTMDNLSNALINPEDIAKGVEARRAIRASQLERDAAEQKIGVAKEKQVLIDERLKAQLADLTRASAEELDILLDQRDTILQTFEVTEKLRQAQREAKDLELDSEEDLLRRKKAGQDSNIAKLESDLAKEKEKKVRVQEEIAENEARLLKEQADLKEKLAATSDVAEQEVLQKALEKSEQILSAIREARADAQREHALKIEEIELDLAEAIKKINEDLLEDKKRLLEKEQDQKKKLADLDIQIAKRLADEQVRQARRAISAARERLSEEEKALKKFEDSFKKSYEERLRKIEMQREFGSLLAKGMSPQDAQAEIVKKFDIKPEGIQRVLNAVEEKKKAFEERRMQLEKQEKDIQRQEERLHQQNVEAAAIKAAEQRQSIIDELQKINEEAAKVEADAKKALGGAKVPGPAIPMPPDQLEEFENATRPKRYGTIDQRLHPEDTFIDEKTGIVVSEPDPLSIFDEKGNEVPFDFGAPKASSIPIELQPDLSIPGSLTSDAFNADDLTTLVEEQSTATAVMEEYDATIQDAAKELGKGYSQQKQALLDAAALLKEQKEALRREQEDFDREFASKGL